ncbi:MAG: PP2C family protein-serine/threonine phosphatase [Thermoanaerobaculia bacterium]
MRIRTQIALAFVLLAILPMTAIVTYSYVSSLRTVRQGVEAEAELLTADMEQRMSQVHREIRRRVERIGALPLRQWVLEDETEAEREALYDSVIAELGDTAPLVERFEFVPEWIGATPEAAPAPEPAQPAPVAAADEPPPPPPIAPIVIDMREMLATVEASIQNLDPESIPGTDKEELIEKAKLGLEFVQEKAQQFNLKAGRVIEIRTDKEELDDELLMTGGAAALAYADEAGDTGASYHLVFEPEVEAPVVEDGAVIGEIRAQVKNEELLRQVLDHTRRAEGEVPFAIAADGVLYAATEEDRSTLETIGLASPVDLGAVGDRRLFDDWVVVTTEDRGIGLTFGIARPIEESLSEMRSTALRNFSVGAGLIGLAMLGVFPLSRRLTHGLNLVSEGAARVANGDLEARVNLESQSEIGQLARAFNDMAHDLQENQHRLLEGERLRVELDRKSEELEEARRFQLSLLPKTLPEHPAYEIAAVMRTATEVGGDYYDFRAGQDGSLTVAIGDATGHGAKAGTMVTVVKSLFSAYPPEGDLIHFQSKAAAAIKQMDLGRMSMALTLARLTGDTLTICAAGMPPVLIHRSDGGVDEIAIEGMPLGGLEFGYRERTVQVAPGDVVLLMSDGFPELPNANGDTLGYERASEHFEATGRDPKGVVQQLVSASEEWAGGSGPADDITFVVLRIR